jgi:hypothetical protein
MPLLRSKAEHCVNLSGDSLKPRYGTAQTNTTFKSTSGMEQFVLLNLCCHSRLEPGVAS